MKNKFEGAVNPESMERESKIVLHFMRHGKKGKAEDDYKVPLTPEGRMEAKDKAVETNLSQAMAMGSPRQRAKESAALVMAGADDAITGEESFTELQAKLDAGRDFGTKVFSDKRLDFTADPAKVLGAKIEEEYGAKRLLTFIVNESDALARETNDNETATYSSMAGGVAEIVKKYVAISARWHELVNDEKKQYEETMERFLGSHQTVTESFLAKIIEKTKGPAERDAFVSAVKGQGFDFLEGFDVEIVQDHTGENPSVRIRYSKQGSTPEESFEFDEEVPLIFIDEMIAEGKPEGSLAERR